MLIYPLGIFTKAFSGEYLEKMQGQNCVAYPIQGRNRIKILVQYLFVIFSKMTNMTTFIDYNLYWFGNLREHLVHKTQPVVLFIDFGNLREHSVHKTQPVVLLYCHSPT